MTTSKVQSEFIATNAISGTIIADNAITATHIATNAISGVLIQDSGIVSTMIAANNVTAAKIVTNGVLTRHVLDDNITAAKLANSINTDIATGVTGNTTANAALPKAGGTMTGDLLVKPSASGATATSGTVGTFESNDNTEVSILGGSSSVLGLNFGHSGDNDEGKITFNTTAGSEDLQIVSSKEITLDAAGDIILDAGGEQVNFSHAGTVIGQVDMGSNNYTLRSKVDNKDIEFHGTSSGNVVALKLDMSEAGAATFNSNITFGDGHTIGNDGDDNLAIASSANENIIIDSADDIILDADGGDIMFKDGGVEKMRLDAGNVGIGITTPNEGGFGATSNVLSIAGTAQDAFGVLELISTDVTSSNRIGEIRFGNLDAGSSFASNAGIRATRDGADNSSALSLWYSNAGTFTQGLYISSQGTIGMGSGSGSLAGSIIINNDGGTGTINNAYYNTGLGWEVFDDLTTGDSNTVIGNQAGYKLTEGANNTFIGRLAGETVSTGGGNIAIGYDSLGGSAAKTANYNVAVGHEALQAVTSGGENICMGRESGHDITDGTQNVSIGHESLTKNQSTSGNTGVGFQSLRIATGASNIAMGWKAGAGITGGGTNIAIGYQALVDTTTTTTGSNNIAIGTNVRASANNTDHHIVIGNNIDSGVNSVAIGKSGNKIENSFVTNATWTRYSDQNLKTNVSTTDLGLTFINKLRPITFNWKDSKDFPTGYEGKDKAKMDTTTKLYGMLAQEVKTALDEVDHSGFGGWSEDHTGVQSLAQSMFIYPLIKAVQELSAKNDALEARIRTLEE